MAFAEARRPIAQNDMLVKTPNDFPESRGKLRRVVQMLGSVFIKGGSTTNCTNGDEDPAQGNAAATPPSESPVNLTPASTPGSRTSSVRHNSIGGAPAAMGRSVGSRKFEVAGLRRLETRHSIEDEVVVGSLP
jgi:hypothetical protein